MKYSRLCILCPIFALIIALLIWLLQTVPVQADTPNESISFMRQIAPILRENCFACHNAAKHKGDFQMTSCKTLLKGGDRGETIVPGKPDESALYTVLTGLEEPQMPPKEAGGKLPAQKIQLIHQWIKEGAKFDGPSTDADLLAELRKLWKPPTPPEKYSRPAVVRALVFSPDGKQLIVGGHHELLVWDWEKGQLLARVRTRAERANAMLFLPDGQTLAVAGGRPGQEGDLRLYWIPQEFKSPRLEVIDGVSSQSEALVRELLQLDDEVLSLALSADGKQLAAGGTDRKVHLWNIQEKNFHPEKVIENHSDWVYSVAFSPDGERLFTASRDRTAKVWNLKKQAAEQTFSEHQNVVNTIAIKPDGKQIVSGGDDNQLRIWPQPGTPRARAIGGFKQGVMKLLYRPKTSQVIAAGADGTIRIINADNGNIVRQLNGHSDSVYALAVSPDANLAASGDWKGEVRIWNLDTGREIQAFQSSPGLKLSKK